MLELEAKFQMPLEGEEIEENELEVSAEDETALALVEMVRDMLGKPSCNDYGCCSCSRQDRDGNDKMVGGSCRVKKPYETNQTCRRGTKQNQF